MEAHAVGTVPVLAGCPARPLPQEAAPAVILLPVPSDELAGSDVI